MRKSDKAKHTPSRTCADCLHFCACHLWAISISTDVAPQCPVFEPVRYRTLAELDDLRQMHKGDLAPVVHARWGNDTDDGYTPCTNCGWKHPILDHNLNAVADAYCPLCGAKMDGGAADG